MTVRREEVGTASGGNNDEEEGGLSAALLYSQADSDRPIGTNRLYCWTHKQGQCYVLPWTNCGEVQKQNSLDNENIIINSDTRKHGITFNLCDSAPVSVFYSLSVVKVHHKVELLFVF